jgi:hypothetical protein
MRAADTPRYYAQIVCVDEVAEWLRRWTANPLGSARVSSNLILVESLAFFKIRNGLAVLTKTSSLI